MPLNRRTAAIALSLVLVSACGQKGALYLPGNTDDARSDIPPAAGTDAGQQEDEATDDDEQG